MDGKKASINETTHHVKFGTNQWHSIKLRVIDEGVQVWIDTEKLIDLARSGDRITSHQWRQGSFDGPLAVFGSLGTAEIRSIRIRQLKPAAGTVSASAVAAPPARRAAPPRTAQGPKWTKLFNGKDLSGWSVDGGDGRQWRVQRGVIVGESASSKTRAYILSDREYSDFSLRFDFLVPVNDARINGGVALRAVTGEQCPYKNGNHGFDHPMIKLTSPSRDARDATGAAHWLSASAPYNLQAASSKMAVGRWHHCEVTVKGEHCTAKFDSVPCVDLTLDAQAPRPFNFVPGLAREKGKVGFQMNTGTMRFRNIEILDQSADKSNLPLNHREPDLSQNASPPKIVFGKWFPLLTSPDQLIGWDEFDDRVRYSNCTLEIRNHGRVGYPVIAKDVSIRARAKKTSGQNIMYILRKSDKGDYRAWFNGGRSFGIGKVVDRKWENLAVCESPQSHEDFFDFEFSVIGDALTLSVNGQPLLQIHDSSHSAGTVSVGGEGCGLFTDVALFIPNEASLVADNRKRFAKPEVVSSAPHREVDLLKLVDPARDAVSGKWSFVDGSCSAPYRPT